MYRVFHWLAKKKKIIKRKCVTAPILNPTDHQKPEIFFIGLQPDCIGVLQLKVGFSNASSDTRSKSGLLARSFLPLLL